MSASIAIVHQEAVHVLADMASYSTTGWLMALISKIMQMPQLDMVCCCRGKSDGQQFVVDAINTSVHTYTEVKGKIAVTLRLAY